MSGIRQLGNNAKANTNTAPAADANQTREERRNDRNDKRDYSQEDRDALRENVRSIRTATQNVFGERSNPTRALTALAGYAQEYIKSKVRSKETKMEVVIVEHGVAVPSVVVVSLTETKDVKDQPLTAVVGHAIMLVDFTRKPEPLGEIREGSVTYQETTVWADALDNLYLDKIEDAIRQQLELENIEYINGGCTTYNFPELPVEKLTNEKSFQDSRLDNLIFTVMTGVEALRALESEEEDTLLRPELLADDSTIVADINLNVNSSKTPANLPVAEDFMIRVREVKNNAGRNRRDRDERSAPRSLNAAAENDDQCYGGVSGRIDFTYVTPEAEYINNPRPEDAACFIPEFVIAGFDVYDRAPSLTMLLQLISSVGILDTREPPIFLQAFKPENIIDAHSRNLGALSAELIDIQTRKPLERVEFRSNTTDEQLRKFARAAILPYSRIAIEVPSQGPLVALLSIFDMASLYAVTNDKKYKDYNDMIIQACDVLTDGEFSENWNSGDAVMAEEIALIPGGYWVDDAGEKRDSREFGYLYYANLENPKEAIDMSREYLSSFNESEDIIAGHIRRKLITEVKGGNFVQTDNFRRCYFDPHFIEVLNSALKSSGLAVQSPNMNFGGRGDERRRRDNVRGLISRDTLENGYSRYSDRRGRDFDSRRDSRRSNSRSFRRR